jgi:ferredoxin
VLLVVVVLFFGKVWCYVCPWDGLASYLERQTFWKVRPGLSLGLRWPKALRNLYPAVALFLGLTWLELGYGVTTRPEMTAWLALVMFFLAFMTALLFERRGFCRYGCLVGQVSGLYSLISSLEIRARDRELCTTCRTKDCYHGNERGYPCPTSQFLGAMKKNTYCVACGECIQTCPNDNVALQVRAFGTDLRDVSPVRFDEAAMVIVMLAMSTFHGLTMTPQWNRIVDGIGAGLHVPHLAAFTIGMFGFLAGLCGLYVVLARVSHAAAAEPGVGFREMALRNAYAFLPIAFFYHLAHNVSHFSFEGGAIVHVISDPFGWGWDLFGTATVNTGSLLSAQSTWLATVALIVVGHVWSLTVGHRIAHRAYAAPRAAFRSEVPMLVAMIAYSVMSLWIVAQPMEMRTGL